VPHLWKCTLPRWSPTVAALCPLLGFDVWLAGGSIARLKDVAPLEERGKQIATTTP
jgi:hypothetical protein